jgi:hypothetical protein
MLELERLKPPALVAAQPREGDDGADVAAPPRQGGDLVRDREVLALDTDTLTHDPILPGHPGRSEAKSRDPCPPRGHWIPDSGFAASGMTT